MKKWDALQEEAKLLYEAAEVELREHIAQDPSAADTVAEKLFNKIVDDLLLESVAHYHRAVVGGYADRMFPEPATSPFHGDPAFTSQIDDFNVKCPKCSRLMSHFYFPHHLQKSCMNTGGGRRSTRLGSGRGGAAGGGSGGTASSTVATVNRTASDPCSSTGTSDDGDDDWQTLFAKSSASHPKKKKIAQKSKNHKKVRLTFYFVLSFTAPPAKLSAIENQCNRDVDVVRNRIYKSVEPEPEFECALEEEIKPPPYRPDVIKMMEDARKKEYRFSKKFKFNTGLDYYPFQR